MWLLLDLERSLEKKLNVLEPQAPGRSSCRRKIARSEAGLWDSPVSGIESPATALRAVGLPLHVPEVGDSLSDRTRRPAFPPHSGLSRRTKVLCQSADSGQDRR